MNCHHLFSLTLAALTISMTSYVNADTIQLRRSVRLKEAGQPICLKDIAILDGELAETLAGTIVSPAPSSERAFEIPLAAVRVSLRDLKVNWGLINISGSKVIVRPAIASVVQPPLAMQSMTIEPLVEQPPTISQTKEMPFIDATSLVLEPTLRGFIAMHALEKLGTDATNTRFAFSRNNSESLRLSASEFRFELSSSGATARSDRIQIIAQVWKNNSHVADHSILIKPKLKTQLAIIKRGINRNETIHERDIEIMTQWLSPTAIQENALPTYAYGRVATSDLRKGDILRSTDVRKKVVIQRGDTVTVNCLIGGHVLRCQAKAQEAGAIGEMIELQKLGERNVFFAVISKPGECVLDFSPTNSVSIQTSTTPNTGGI